MFILPVLLKELECVWINYSHLEFLVDRCCGLSTAVATAEEQPLPVTAVILSIFTITSLALPCPYPCAVNSRAIALATSLAAAVGSHG